jgi:glucosamine--fructose-6-phosphate aminotransferase (isomerizing)
MPSPSLLEQEISEQPAALRRLLGSLDKVPWLRTPLRGPMWVVARGSSDNAGRYLQYLAGLRLNIACGLVTPSVITRYGIDLAYEGTVVAISQSGESEDVLTVVESARRRSQRTIAITNSADSPLAAAADHVLLMGAGIERSVAASKTYTTSLLASSALVELSSGEAGGRFLDLLHVPGLVEEAIASIRLDAEVERAVLLLRETEHCVVAGRGVDFSTAHEIALKITELTGVLAVAMSPADLMHGPVAALGPRTPLIAVGALQDDLGMGELMSTATERSTPIIRIGQGSSRASEVHLSVPACPPHLSPMVNVVAGQWLAMKLAADRGLSLDRPFSLSKVTSTR